MKKFLCISVIMLACQSLCAANKTFPLKGTIVSPADKNILYTGRVSFTNPQRPAWNYPAYRSLPPSRVPPSR